MLAPHRRRPRDRRLLRGLAALVAALGVHAALVGLVVLASLVSLRGGERPRPPRPTSRPVVLRGLTAEQYARNRGEPAPAVRDERKVVAKRRAEQKPDDPVKSAPTSPGQVVAVPQGNDQVPREAKYAAESSNTVARETRAKETTPFYRNAQHATTAPTSAQGEVVGAPPAPPSGNDGLGDSDAPRREASAQPAFEVPDVQRRTEVTIKEGAEGAGVAVANRTEQEAVQGNARRLNLQPGSPGGEAGEPSLGHLGTGGLARLMPSPAALDRIIGGAANDKLDLPEGEGTYLNTREWKYASFFNRVKQRVGQTWNPMSQLRLRDPTGQIYGGRDRYTMLSVTLDADGRLKDAWVERSSGLDFLDLEAVQAFERAQPFPNPPPGLLASDQTVRFQFGFFLEMTGRPGLRLFRSTQ